MGGAIVRNLSIRYYHLQSWSIGGANRIVTLGGIVLLTSSVIVILIPSVELVSSSSKFHTDSKTHRSGAMYTWMGPKKYH